MLTQCKRGLHSACWCDCAGVDTLQGTDTVHGADTVLGTDAVERADRVEGINL